MFDMIGTLYSDPVLGEVDPETGVPEVIAPTQPFPGYRVNTTPEVFAARPELEEFQITPNRLRRVWAGDDPYDPQTTIALRFESEEQANAILFPEAE